MCHIFRPFHPPRFYHPRNIWWWIQIMRVLIKQFLPFSCYVLLLMPGCVPQHYLFENPLPVIACYKIRIFYTFQAEHFCYIPVMKFPVLPSIILYRAVNKPKLNTLSNVCNSFFT
jgi:hypothetical protein